MIESRVMAGCTRRAAIVESLTKWALDLKPTAGFRAMPEGRRCGHQRGSARDQICRGFPLTVVTAARRRLDDARRARLQEARRRWPSKVSARPLASRRCEPLSPPRWRNSRANSKAHRDRARGWETSRPPGATLMMLVPETMRLESCLTGTVEGEISSKLSLFPRFLNPL